ncbi:MAG: HDIG domain-containing metalloprotein [Anaerolineales bacterium]
MPAFKLTRRDLFLGLIFLLFCGFILLALLLPILQDLSEPPLSVGDVAPYDIHAPVAITYHSQILTSRQQDAAAAAVPIIYSPADTNIARQQLERLRNTLVYINSVRADGFAAQELKISDLAGLENIQLSRDAILAILSLSASRWSAVSEDATSVLDQVMREPIREDQLISVDQKIPTLVSLSFPIDQSAIITSLVQAFVVPNSLYDEQLTEAARQQARDNVTPVTRSFMTNETIIQGGKVITVTDYEALQQFGLALPKNRWQDIVSSLGLTFLTAAIFIIYFRRNPILISGNPGMRKLALLVTLFLLFLFIARISIPGHAVIPYAYPVMGFALTISALFSAELAIISVIPMAFLISYGLPDSQVLTLYYLIASLFGVFVLRQAQRLTSFFWAGAAIAVSGATVAIAFRIIQPTADWIGVTTLALAAIINGIASASIGLIFHYYLAQFLGKTTHLQLIELSRPDHPLQQLLLRNAPGTYQHSLQLANLVEQAAETIGADAMLARVGALYHDIGKIPNPYFFIENQPPGNVNPHNDLDPEISAATIIRHVSDGLELARKYHLPKQLYDFIAQHHGTTITRYQYSRALELAGMNKDAVDMDKFRYPGPRPSSREIALLMLADTSEARMRAERPKDEDELHKMIKSVIKDKLELGELDNTQLTLQNLEEIIDSFTSTLRGVYHPRIQYPKTESELKTRPVPYRIPDGDSPQVTPDNEPLPTQEKTG